VTTEKKDRVIYVEGDQEVPGDDEDIVTARRRDAVRMTRKKAWRVARDLRSRGFTVRVVHLVPRKT
jgi:hypothetical protein